MSKIESGGVIYQGRVTFHKTTESYGWMHNMCRGYPIEVGPITFKSSEALYQCFRFPDRPDIQRVIVAAPDGFQAKLAAKQHLGAALRAEDWDAVRVERMRVAVELKFRQNLGIAAQLHALHGQQIVELSTKDAFWGARIMDGQVVGSNVLGQILMRTCDKLYEGRSLSHEEAAHPFLHWLLAESG